MLQRLRRVKGSHSTPLFTERRQKFRLTYETLNDHVKKMEYAVRGMIPQEAARIQKAITKVSPWDS